ncbi:MAG: cytochrome c biogenesis protein CcdA [Acidaminobacteraceae bacterium]
MFEETSYLLVFIAGVLSFFSPCFLPLIPAYVMYIAGVSAEEDMDFNRKKSFHYNFFWT